MSMNLSRLDLLEKVAMALDSQTRLKIIQRLTKKSYTILELANELNISLSNTSSHIKLLKDAGLINITHNSSKRGNEKIVALEKNSLEIFFNENDFIKEPQQSNCYKIDLPIGSFFDFSIVSPCGMADEDGNLIGKESDPSAFYHYKRMKAEIIWFTKGYLQYHLSNTFLKGKKLESIEISLEICSECANYNNSYKSDITFYLNQIDLGTYTSLGDFGGRKGINTPTSWPNASTQFGKLLQIRIDKNGCFFNQIKMDNNLSIESFSFLMNEPCIQFKISVEEDSKYVGGINLFGKKFGDYPQGIRFHILYK